MKKTRFIPYGYTMRNGRTVIEHGEADIIRYIFDEYIKGASLKDLAEELTARKVPYTEKTEVWDKARIARIIDNAKYTGSEIYDPIIDEDTFEEAAAAKAARLRNQTVSECEGTTLMRDRIRCGQCGAPMHQPPGLRKEILYRIHHSGRASPPKSHRKSIEPI